MMYDVGWITITNGVRSAFCSLLSRLAGEKSDKLIQNQTKCEKRIRAMTLFRVTVAGSCHI